MEMPTGIIADAFGRRGSMILSFLSYIISFTIFFFLPSFAFYILAMICFGLGEAFRTGTHKAMILEYLRLSNMLDLKVDYYGHTRACSQRGSALSSLIAAGLVLYSGSYRIVFLASVIPYILALLLMISYPRSLDGTVRQENTGNPFKDALQQIKSTLKDFIDIFKNPRFLKILFNSSSFDSVFKTVKDYIQPILKNYALAFPILLYITSNRRVAILTGIIYFLLYFLTSLASSSAGRLLNRIHSLPKVINCTFLLGGIFILITGSLQILSLPLVSILFFILVYMLQNLRRPLTVGYLSEQISNRVMASGLSGESQVKTILVALLSPLMGFLADILGVGTALAIMGLLLLSFLPALKIKQQSERVT